MSLERMPGLPCRGQGLFFLHFNYECGLDLSFPAMLVIIDFYNCARRAIRKLNALTYLNQRARVIDDSDFAARSVNQPVWKVIHMSPRIRVVESCRRSAAKGLPSITRYDRQPESLPTGCQVLLKALHILCQRPKRLTHLLTD